MNRLLATSLLVMLSSGAHAFAQAGAQLSDDSSEVWACDAVVTIAPPDPEQIRALGANTVRIFIQPSVFGFPAVHPVMADRKDIKYIPDRTADADRQGQQDAFRVGADIKPVRSRDGSGSQ